LPDLPNTLESLDCRDNKLLILPLLPNSLNYIDAGGNPFDLWSGLTALTQINEKKSEIIIKDEIKQLEDEINEYNYANYNTKILKLKAEINGLFDLRNY